MPELFSSERLRAILQSWIAGQTVPASERHLLEAWMLGDRHQAQAFGITPENVSEIISERINLFQQVYPSFDPFCRTDLGWQSWSLETLWQLWLPLTIHLAQQRRSQKTAWIQGILGGQGTGKTTLTRILTHLLNQLGYQVCRLSLDDLYKTYDERQRLQQDDPRLRWRGPPGTHEVKLGIQTLQQLRQAEATQIIEIPRFDKSLQGGAGDRTTPDLVTAPEIVLFEGWFVGVRPIDSSAFEQAPPPIETEADRAFARDCNERLKAYLPLWDQLDSLMVLYPTDYRLSQQWRQQAEQQMIAAGRSGMSDEEIHQFVEYFWRSLHPQLFIEPLLTDSQRVDLVIEIHSDHTPGAIYRAGDRPIDLNPQP